MQILLMVLAYSRLEHLSLKGAMQFVAFLLVFIVPAWFLTADERKRNLERRRQDAQADRKAQDAQEKEVRMANSNRAHLRKIVDDG